MGELINGLYYPRTRDINKWKSQANVLEEIYTYVTDWRCALDCGAFVGLWSRSLVKKFNKVYAFEPLPENAEYFSHNCPEAILSTCAIARESGELQLGRNGLFLSSIKGKPSSYPAVSIDSLNLNPGFIKLDLEGGDLNALLGAEETIERCSPVICVEVKDDPFALAYWRGLNGYRVVAQYGKYYKHKPPRIRDEVWIRSEFSLVTTSTSQ